VDTLAGFLDGPRARGAFLLRCIMDPPWSIRVQDNAPLTVVSTVRGTAWIVPDDGAAAAIGPGDVAVVRGPDHYVVADEPTRVPDIVIHPGGRCTTLGGASMEEAMDLGVRTWGNSATGSSTMLVGTYETESEISRRLLESLPMVIVLAHDTWDSPLVPLLAEEIVKEAPGQEVVLDRLLDLLLVAVLRTWFSRQGTDVPPWYSAYGDPVVGRALRMIHNDPSHPWTVGDLAAGAGASRAALARRFNELVGEPPMSFLTGWRMALAADLLVDSDATVGAVAQQVGYASPFTFSAAFKRAYGVSPKAYRTQQTALAAPA
jgi:AraC-like DNA-binding protein